MESLQIPVPGTVTLRPTDQREDETLRQCVERHATAGHHFITVDGLAPVQNGISTVGGPFGKGEIAVHVAEVVRLLKAENVDVVMDDRVPIGASASARRTPNALLGFFAIRDAPLH